MYTSIHNSINTNSSMNHEWLTKYNFLFTMLHKTCELFKVKSYFKAQR